MVGGPPSGMTMTITTWTTTARRDASQVDFGPGLNHDDETSNHARVSLITALGAGARRKAAAAALRGPVREGCRRRQAPEAVTAVTTPSLPVLLPLPVLQISRS